MALVSLFVGVDFEDVYFVRIFLFLHRKQGQHAWFHFHRCFPDFLGKCQIFFQKLGYHFDFGKADNSFAILAQWNVLAKQPSCIVGEYVLRIQSVGGKAIFQCCFTANKYLFGNIRIVAAVKNMVGGGDCKERINDFVGRCAGKVVI